MTATATDTFTLHDDGADQELLRRWVLALEKNPKGLARVGIEVFKGRGGYQEIGDLMCSDADGNAVEDPGTVATFDAKKVAAGAFGVCKKYHREHALERYRIQLYYVKKKGGEPHKGDAVAIKFKDGEADLVGEPFDAGTFLIKSLMEENKRLREYNDKLLAGQVGAMQANTANMMTGIRIVQVALKERESAADHYANLKTRATPQDWNNRIATVGQTIENTVARLAPYIGAGLHGQAPFGKPPGAPPPPPNGAPQPPPGPPPGPPGDWGATQANCRAFFEGLSGEQSDKLRDGLPEGTFAEVAELLHGPVDMFEANFAGFRGLLVSHFALLSKVLTPEQLAQLQAAAG